MVSLLKLNLFDKMTELELQCVELAYSIAEEINGDVSRVPDEDMEAILLKLNRNNIQEIAEEIAELAHWFN